VNLVFAAGNVAIRLKHARQPEGRQVSRDERPT
jgi:hypothetical protein